MKTKALLASFILSVMTVGPAAQAADFSVKDWSKEMDQALTSGNSARLKSLTNLATLKKTSLRSPERTGEKAIIEKARDLYAKGQFAKAIETYDKVPRGSDQWLEAVEEKGWAYHRMGDFEKALSQTKTLTEGPFVTVVGSEPFFLQALSQLKICAYKNVLETTQHYKETQRNRIVTIQTLSKTGHTDSIENLIAKADHFPLRISEVGTETVALPRLFFRDMKVQEALLDLKLGEAAKAYSTRSNLSATARQALAGMQRAGTKAKARLSSRLQQLAKDENMDNFKMLQKLNLIEVETIQRVHADMETDPDTYKKGQFAKVDVDTLVFPDDGNPWMDELDKYQTSVNSCPRNIRRKM